MVVDIRYPTGSEKSQLCTYCGNTVFEYTFQALQYCKKWPSPPRKNKGTMKKSAPSCKSDGSAARSFHELQLGESIYYITSQAKCDFGLCRVACGDAIEDLVRASWISECGALCIIACINNKLTTRALTCHLVEYSIVYKKSQGDCQLRSAIFGAACRVFAREVNNK